MEMKAKDSMSKRGFSWAPAPVVVEGVEAMMVEAIELRLKFRRCIVGSVCEFTIVVKDMAASWKN